MYSWGVRLTWFDCKFAAATTAVDVLSFVETLHPTIYAMFKFLVHLIATA